MIPLSTTVEKFDWPDMTADKLGSLVQLQQALENGGSLHWYPAETNTSIRHGWFWRDENQTVRGVAELLDIWYRTVGGNTVFLLNVPPDRYGRFPERDCRILVELGEIIKKTFAGNLAKGATARAMAVRGAGFDAANVLDGKYETCWMPPPGQTACQIVLRLKSARRFNRVMLQEHIGRYGQRIAAFALDVYCMGEWQEVASGQTVGYKKICRFRSVTSDRLRIRILDSRVCPTLSEVGLYLDSYSDGIKIKR